MKWTPRTGRLAAAALLAIAFGALAVFFGLYDLQISQALVNPEHWLGASLEYLGTLIAPFLAVLAGLAVAVYYYKADDLPRHRLYLALGCLSALGGLGYASYIFAKLSKPGALGAIAAAALLFGVWARWLLLHDRQGLESLLRIAVLTIADIAAVLAVVGVVKLFWGRLRYRDMADAANFTRWFLPQGFTGNASFPSGHTANAATLYVLTLFAPLVRHKWAKFLCYFVPIASIVTMAASRVLAGAHYASDVLVGGSLAILLFYVLKWLFRRRGVDWSFPKENQERLK